MKSILLAAAVLLAASNACAEMNPDTSDAWLLEKNGYSEIVFSPVVEMDRRTGVQWLSAISCDIKAEECAAFRFGLEGAVLTKVSEKDAKAFLESN